MLARTLSAVGLSLLLSTLLLSWSCSSSSNGTGGSGHENPGSHEPTKNGLTKQQAAEALVKIGDRTITVGEFADRLADQSPYLRARYNSPERRQEFLDNMVRFELLAAEAHRRGLDKVPEVDRTRKQLMIQEMMKQEYEQRVRLEDISDADVQRYYNEHADEFHKPEQVRASHIQIRDRAKAQRVLAQILAHPSDVNLFRQLAEQNNEDAETRDRFGDLRFFSRPSEHQPDEPNVPPAVAEAAFAISQIGGVAPQLVQTPDGYHIVKLTGRRAALNRTLDEARRPIQNKLWRERREGAVEDLVARLRREANVQVDERLLQQIRVEAEPGESPTTAPLPPPGGGPGAMGSSIVPPPAPGARPTPPQPHSAAPSPADGHPARTPSAHASTPEGAR